MYKKNLAPLLVSPYAEARRAFVAVFASKHFPSASPMNS